ncbi:hypothetical protein SK128_012423 [Halocaridina rubra]|uniref:Uncharacterized protein n=1 Tax=Halocaridina rubra TaxID=373956 RepID=A0AAN9A9T9_HALRR
MPLEKYPIGLGDLHPLQPNRPVGVAPAKRGRTPLGPGSLLADLSKPTRPAIWVKHDSTCPYISNVFKMLLKTFPLEPPYSENIFTPENPSTSDKSFKSQDAADTHSNTKVVILS